MPRLDENNNKDRIEEIKEHKDKELQIQQLQQEKQALQDKLTETKSSLENVSGDFQQFMDYTLSKLPN